MKRPGGQRRHAAAIETRKPDQGVVCPGPRGDPKVARMAKKRKGCVRLVPHVLGSCPGRSAARSPCEAVRCRAGAVTNADAWYGPGSAERPGHIIPAIAAS